MLHRSQLSATARLAPSGAALSHGPRACTRGRSQRATAAAAADSDPSTSGSRGVLILPGLGNGSGDYSDLTALIQKRGMQTAVAPVGRLDWGRNAAAIADINWWKGTLKPRPAVDWYLERVDQALDELKRRVGGGPITILSHSAGGWLGRVYLLHFGTAGVDRFVSLGSPHLPPPAGVIDQTRGLLTHVQEVTPGAFHPEITYVTVASRYVKGVKLSHPEGDWLAKFAGAGYEQVCGSAETWGDFIVPVDVAHLEGATNVDLEGVFHSPLGTQFLGDWYGSPAVVDAWGHHLDGSAPTTAAAASQPAAVSQTVA